MTPAVFLDRDGTLIEEVGYLDRLDRFALFPWTIDALRLLQRAGFKLVLVTNQAGVARGFFGESFVHEANRHLADLVAVGGVRFDGVYYCPHHPEGSVERYRRHCECRKPKPGMVHRAARELALDLARSFVVGDRWLDVELAHNAGASGILVRTGHGEVETAHPGDAVEADAIVDNLMGAVSWILGRVQAPAAGA